MKIKKIDFEKDDFMERTVISGGQEQPRIESGLELTLKTNGYELSVIVATNAGDNQYVGKVIKFENAKEKYSGLEIGDKITFKKENICSIS